MELQVPSMLACAGEDPERRQLLLQEIERRKAAFGGKFEAVLSGIERGE